MGEARWVALASGLLIESIAGSSYAFGVFSPQVKTELNYTQSEIETVGSAGNIGLYTSIVAGLAIDSIGSVYSVLIGGLLSFIGYFLWYLSAAQIVSSNVYLLSLYSFIASHGSAWLDTCVVTSGVVNFRPNKGTMVGLLKSNFGLSASMLTLFYSNVFKPNVNSFLLFLAIITSAIPFLCSFVLRLVPKHEGVVPLSSLELRKVTFLYLGVILLALYIIAMSLLQNRNILSTSYGFPVGMVAILLIMSGASMYRLKEGSGKPVDPEDASEQLLLEGQTEDGSSASVDDVEASSLKVVDDTEQGASFFEGFLSLDMLLILMILFTGTGSGLVIINNLGSIVQSLGAPQDGQDVYVSLLSISNMAGRMLFGYISDLFASRLRRPWFLLVCVASMGLCCVLLSMTSLNLLYLGVIWAGVSYGGFWSLTPTVLSDIFGSANFASIYSVSTLASAAASFILNAQLAASIYAMNSPPGSTVCIGPNCYRATFLILAGLCLFGSLCAIYLALRCRNIYNEDGSLRPYDEFSQDHGVSKVGSYMHKHFSACCRPKCGRKGDIENR
jgi:MFS family permease